MIVVVVVIEAVFVGQTMMKLLSISAVCMISLMLFGTTSANSDGGEVEIYLTLHKIKERCRPTVYDEYVGQLLTF